MSNPRTDFISFFQFHAWPTGCVHVFLAHVCFRETAGSGPMCPSLFRFLQPILHHADVHFADVQFRSHFMSIPGLASGVSFSLFVLRGYYYERTIYSLEFIQLLNMQFMEFQIIQNVNPVGIAVVPLFLCRWVLQEPQRIFDVFRCECSICECTFSMLDNGQHETRNDVSGLWALSHWADSATGLGTELKANALS